MNKLDIIYNPLNINIFDNSYLDFFLINLECKHIISEESNHLLKKLADKVFYPWIILGSHRKANLDDEKERIIEMMKSDYERPIRIIIDKDKRLWADNTHWSIAYILKYGKNIKIKDVPFYIVDLNNNMIISSDGAFEVSKDNIKNVLECSNRIKQRLEIGWRSLNVSFTIKNLITDLKI